LKGWNGCCKFAALVLVYISKDVPFGIFSEHTVTIPNGSDFGGRKETVLLVSL
jgi:hypothetical protein